MSVTDNHDGEKTSSAVQFLKALFSHTEQPIFLQTLANDAGDVDEAANKRHLLSRDIGAIERFVAKHDRARRGMFCCVATVAEGSRTRSKETVREIVTLHQDLDFKGIAEGEPAIWEAIGRLECRPSIEVRSGGGIHLYWLLREPLIASECQDRLEVCLRALAEIVAGDTATCEISRLMRLPSTHNSKYGDMREVVLERCEPDLTYELEDLEDWIDRQQAVLTRTVADSPEQSAIVRKNEAETNPFLRLASQMGYKPRLDVEQALSAMDKGNIHDTQVRVSASLIHGGREVEEVVAILMEATRRQVNSEGWNWQAEERSIRRACEGALKKFPPRQIEDENVATNEGENVATNEAEAIFPVSEATITDLNVARAARAAKVPVRAGKVNHIDIGEIFLAGLAAGDERLMVTENGIWIYCNGLWATVDDKALRGWIDPQLEQCIRGTSAKSTLRLVSEARAWILRHPDLQRRAVPFDRHGMVPTVSGLINPRTGAVFKPEAAHFCTWQVPFRYDPVAKCPHWLDILEEAFADRGVKDRREYGFLLQEWAGVGLIDRKAKALARALTFVGGSNSGKSTLLDVLSGLYGERVNTTPIDVLDGPHGTIAFLSRMPWMLHEAFDASKWHLSSMVKAIIEGKPIQINIKGGRIFEHVFTGPVLWGANAQPQFKEATKAITNRLLLIECRREFDEDNPIGVAVMARAAGLERPSELVLRDEMPGVLAWAFEGLRRALARGFFLIPTEARAALESVRRDSNLVQGFVEDACDFDMNGMVSAPDFSAAFASWWLEHKGGDSRIPSGDSIGRALKALGNSRIAIDLGLRSNSRRYYAGVWLNAEGRRHWNNSVSSDAFVFQGRKASTTEAAGNPNAALPGSWDGKGVIIAMRVAQAKFVTHGSDTKSPSVTPRDTSDTSVTHENQEVSYDEPQEDADEIPF